LISKFKSKFTLRRLDLLDFSPFALDIVTNVVKDGAIVVGVQKWSRQKLGEKSTHTLVIYYQSIKYNKRIHA